MKNEFIPFQQALELKELGFNEPCLAYYNVNNELTFTSIVSQNTNSFWLANPNNITSTPLYQQAFRWFRDEYGLRGFIGFRPNVKQFDFHIYDMYLSGKEYVKQRTMEEFNKDPKVGTYEEAELACLIKLIEITKN
jgi:hypothetical protein